MKRVFSLCCMLGLAFVTLGQDIVFVPADKAPCKVGVPFQLKVETKGTFVQWESASVTLIQPFEATDNKTIWFVPMVPGPIDLSAWTSIDNKPTKKALFSTKAAPNDKLYPKPPNINPKPVDPVKPIDPVKPVDPVKPDFKAPYKVMLFVDNTINREVTKAKTDLLLRNLLDSTKSDLQEWPIDSPWIDQYKWRDYVGQKAPSFVIVDSNGFTAKFGSFTTSEALTAVVKEVCK
jgi:hypothetical protein